MTNNKSRGYSVLEADLKKHVDGEVRFDRGSLALYNCDASNYRQIPIGVVIPKTKEAVVETVAACRKHGVPIVSRGGGTALAGQSCNEAVVIDFSKYLSNIIEIDVENKTATVEPGVILDHLRTRTERHGLTFGPDPATHTHCTFGGMIGNNSCGIHSVMAGRTVDNVLELEILTYDGVRMRAGPTSEEDFALIDYEGGRKGEIYQKLKEIRDAHADQIRNRYPNIPRRVSGYNLDELLPERGFNVARALVGSEGTLAIVLEAKIRLVDSPPARSLLVLGYPDVFSAGDHVPRIMEFGPVGLEGIDDTLIDFMKKKGLHTKQLPLLPEGRGWLLVEFGGQNKGESDHKARQCMEALNQEKSPPSMKLYDNISDEKRVWEIRESGLGATANVPGLPLAWPGWEDAAVPPDKVGDYLRDFRALLDKYGYLAALYGHFGQGCIHCRITFDLLTHEGIEKYMSFADEASDLVVKYNGSFSGEHGDGQSKAYFLSKIYGPELLGAFEEMKRIFDPQWKMNPGKVVAPDRPDENLRLGVGYRPWLAETEYAFPKDDHSLERATLRCVGVGKCRRTEDAFMCPSFIVTREEKDTTRGRAHLLFEMFRGDLITSGWRSKEVLESLDLCLACKGCKKDCPVDVDMATYKSEFLYHHFERRLRPRVHYALGHIGILAAMGSKVPRLANFFARTPVFSFFAKKLVGVARLRSLPKFARQTFHKWYARHKKVPTGRPQVCLFPDVFNDCFHPHVLQAVHYDLERLGFDVLVPEKRLPAVRPLIHYGFLKKAKKGLRRIIEELRPYYSQGIDIVFAEPSTAAVFRDELPSLFPTDHDAARLTSRCMLLSEFIAHHGLEVPKLGGKALLHAHCHQKVSLDADPIRELLQSLDLEVEEPWEGCCGMAGSFGFEANHYDLSMKVAEEKLLPAVRAASDETRIIADGFSCRTQIQQGTDREAHHLAEIVKLAFERAEETGEVEPVWHPAAQPYRRSG